VLAVEGGSFIGAMYVEEERARALGLTGDALLHRNRPANDVVTVPRLA
jgi:hypothetical protein